MSGHNYFTDLRLHGQKLVKFKQGVLIEDLHTSGQITEEQQHIRNHGACAALCCMWLYTKLYGMKSLNRSEGTRVDLEINRPFAKIGVAVQTEYMRNFEATEWSRLTTAMYDEFGLSFTIDGDRHAGVGTILGQGASLLAHSPGVMLSLDLSDTSGHAIAMCRIEGVDYFFDPNAGEYRVGHTVGFLKAYARAARNALGKSITGGHRVAVSRK